MSYFFLLPALLGTRARRRNEIVQLRIKLRLDLQARRRHLPPSAFYPSTKLVSYRNNRIRVVVNDVFVKHVALGKVDLGLLRLHLHGLFLPNLRISD